MSFELKITKDFMEMTDAMIQVLKQKNVTLENGNLLLVKVPVENTSTITIVEGKFQMDQVYQSGLARVIGSPRLLDPLTDAKLSPGDFVIFSHASKYTISSLVCQWLLGVKLSENKPLDFVEEYNNFPVVAITDRDVIAVLPPKIPAEVVIS